MVDVSTISWTKDVTLDTGVVASFWVLGEMHLLLQDAKGQIKYYGYLNSDAYAAGKDMLIEKAAVLDFANFDPQGKIVGAFLQMTMAAQAAEIAG